MDAATLADVMQHAPGVDYAQWTEAFNEALVEAGCTTVDRVAMFCAQVGEESGGLRWMEELATGSEYEGRADLGNTQPGDGARFKGRGPIQITGRNNYAHLSQWAYGKGYVPSPDYFVRHPRRLAWRKYVFLGPVWYWTVARNMNAYADRADIHGATLAVNGGTNGLADRTHRWNHARSLGKALLPTAPPTPKHAKPAPKPKPKPPTRGRNVDAAIAAASKIDPSGPRRRKVKASILKALRSLPFLK